MSTSNSTNTPSQESNPDRRLDSVELTREEIQEGYDISLLALEPRNSSCSTTNSSSLLGPLSSKRPTSSSSSSSSRGYEAVPSLGRAGGGAGGLAAKKYEARAREVERENLKKRRQSAGVGFVAIGTVERSGGGGVTSRLLGKEGGRAGGEEEEVHFLGDEEKGGGITKGRRWNGRTWVWILLVVGLLLVGLGVGVGVGIGRQPNGRGEGKENAVSAESEGIDSATATTNQLLTPSSIPSTVSEGTGSSSAVDQVSSWERTTFEATTTAGDWTDTEGIWTPSTPTVEPTSMEDGGSSAAETGWSTSEQPEMVADPASTAFGEGRADGAAGPWWNR
ncbi:hypothetical protein JCM16303_005550 [Sporobolomyces ruberrimus]